jgi:hypothetical protein
MILVNQTQDALYLMLHSLKDADQSSLTESIDLAMIMKNKVVIAEPNTAIDISTDEEINHYVQIGVKVYQKLIFSKLLITIKSQIHTIVLREGDYVVFLTLNLDSSGTVPHLTVTPFLLLTPSLPDRYLVLLHSGPSFHQLLLPSSP